MEYKYKFKPIIASSPNVDYVAEKCSYMAKKLVEKQSINFAEWLRYNDEVFEKYACNKIGLNTLYNMFVDDTKP